MKNNMILIVKFWPVVWTIALVVSTTIALLQGETNLLLKLFFGHGLIVDGIIGYFGWCYKLCMWHRVLILNLMAGVIFAYLNNRFWGMIPVVYYRTILICTSISIIISATLYFKNKRLTQWLQKSKRR
jgi:hypothetical protein